MLYKVSLPLQLSWLVSLSMSPEWRQAATGWSRWMTWWSWGVNQIPCVSSPTSSPSTTTCASLSEAQTSRISSSAPFSFESQPFSTLFFVKCWAMGCSSYSLYSVLYLSWEEIQSWHGCTLKRLDRPPVMDQWTFIHMLQEKPPRCLAHGLTPQFTDTQWTLTPGEIIVYVRVQQWRPFI